MIEAFSKSKWRRTLLFLLICGVLATAAGVVGVSDNLAGLSLALLSATALVLAFVYPWRTPKRYLLLIGASVLMFIASTVLSNVFGDGSAAGGLFFFIAIWLCPAGLLVGIIGTVTTFITSRREHQQHVPPGSRVA
jgi:hypothetical protein